MVSVSLISSVIVDWQTGQGGQSSKSGSFVLLLRSSGIDDKTDFLTLATCLNRGVDQQNLYKSGTNHGDAYRERSYDAIFANLTRMDEYAVFFTCAPYAIMKKARLADIEN